MEFFVEAQAAGPVTVTVVVQDGVKWLKSLALTATAGAPVAPVAAAVFAAPGPLQPEVLASASTPLPASADQPDFEDYFTIQVQEARFGADTKFLYVVSCPRLGISERFESLPLRARSDYIAATLADVKRAWDDHGAGAAYLETLQDIGADLFGTLFPEDLRALLWANRSKLAPMVLRADEPDVPWELIHLKPANGTRQKAPAFLGQLGMLRWPFDGYPQATLRARPGRVRVLCPDRAGPAAPGAGVRKEADFLEQRLGASSLPGTEAALRTRAVEQNARLPRDDGSGPLVVLNACQLGRGGDQLTGSGGFAKAFLSTGAAAYVAALWSIHDTPAHDFVTSFYDRLLAGDTVAESAAAAREKARAAGDATWLSYVIYARPDARLVTQ